MGLGKIMAKVGDTLALLEAVVQKIMVKLHCLVFEMNQKGPGVTLKARYKLFKHLNRNYKMEIFSGFGLMTSLILENLILP
jgi:hypothetical protein